MIKIINKGINSNKEITVPFITKCNNDHYMYIRAKGKIKPVDLSTGALQANFYDSIEIALENLDKDEQIVDAEITIK